MKYFYFKNYRKTILTFLFLLFCSVVIFPSDVYGQRLDPKNLLINNTRLITYQNDTSHVDVNILIRNNVIELVTQDPITTPDNVTALDARGGYLLGNVSTGSAPKFLILRKDPRQNFRLWFDFESNMIFAIEDGILHRNRLYLDIDKQPNVKSLDTKVSWFAYTPPPIALPVMYGHSKRWNYWDNDYVSGLFTAVGGLDRLFWLNQRKDGQEQVGDLKQNAGGAIRGIRFGSVGKLNFFKKPWSYTVFLATLAFDKGFEEGNKNSLVFFDYRIDIPLLKKMSLSIGKQKEPISLERINSSIYNQMLERVSDAFLPGRNFGLQLNGTLLDNQATWAAALFNSWIDNGGSFGDNETVVMGRITGAPKVSDFMPGVVHLGVTNRYSNGRSGINYNVKPEIFKSPAFIQSGYVPTDFMNLVCVEASYLNGPLWVFSEYTHNHIKSANDGNLNLSTFQVTGSWVLTGEHRSYNYNNGSINPIPVANSILQGGIGAWELTARFSNYNLMDLPTQPAKMNIASLGVNCWLTNAACLSVNYLNIRQKEPGSKGVSNAINARLMLLLN
jgi:phosphate-selective porin OprO/OprP